MMKLFVTLILACYAATAHAQSAGIGLTIEQNGGVVPLSDPTGNGPVIGPQNIVLRPAPFAIQIPQYGCLWDDLEVYIRVLPQPADNYSGEMNEVILGAGIDTAFTYLYPEANGFAQFPGAVRQLLMSPRTPEPIAGWPYHFIVQDRFSQRGPDYQQIDVNKVIADDHNLLITGDPFVLMIAAPACEGGDVRLTFDLISVTFNSE